MTRWHELSLGVPEIDDAVLMIETNDAGGMPVLYLEAEGQSCLQVFNWRTRQYEPAIKVIIL